MKKIQIYLCIALLFSAKNTYAQKIVDRSDSSRPEWLKELPKAGNNTFYYLKAEGVNANLNDARSEGLNRLAFDLTKTINVKVINESKRKNKSTYDSNKLNEDISIEYQQFYKIESDMVTAVLQKIDEYWDATVVSGTVVYRSYTLYAISKTGSYTDFDEVSFTYKYGADALWRSALVPGYGQLYKGDKAKGFFIMGGEALLIGGIFVCEAKRADYKRKSKETLSIGSVKNNLDNADNFETWRNVCIGGAAALYIYNIIDAVATNGRKRTVVKRNHISLVPAATTDFSGVSLAFNF